MMAQFPTTEPVENIAIEYLCKLWVIIFCQTLSLTSSTSVYLRVAEQIMYLSLLYTNRF